MAAAALAQPPQVKGDAAGLKPLLRLSPMGVVRGVVVDEEDGKAVVAR